LRLLNNSRLLLISTTLVVGREGKVTAMKANGQTLAMIVRWAIDATRIAEKTAGPLLDVQSLSRAATADLMALGIVVLTNSAVDRIDEQGVVASGRRVAARNVFWAAGVMASPAAKWLKAEADPAGRVKVGEDLSVPRVPGVFAIGDTALSNGWKGKPVPGLAPAAKQQGRYVASVIRASIDGRPRPAPFRYRHAGSLATIGRKAAVADFGRLQLSGALAWWCLGRSPHPIFVGDAEPFSCRPRMVLGVSHLPSQHSPDHRRNSNPDARSPRAIDRRVDVAGYGYYVDHQLVSGRLIECWHGATTTEHTCGGSRVVRAAVYAVKRLDLKRCAATQRRPHFRQTRPLSR
jgi:Pyridine nucleotide-disulphide oxidoreductase